MTGVVLPLLPDGIDIVGVGSPRGSPRSQHASPRTSTNSRLPAAGPAHEAQAKKRNLAGVAKLLQDMCAHMPTNREASPARLATTIHKSLRVCRMSGTAGAGEFARVVGGAEYEWLMALGVALRELGSLVENGKHIAVKQHKAFAAQHARIAAERQEMLDRLSSERDELRSTVVRLEKEAAKLREDLNFLSIFEPHAPATNALHGGQGAPGAAVPDGTASTDNTGVFGRDAGGVRSSSSARGRVFRLAMPRPPPRPERIAALGETLRKHDAESAARVALLMESHAAEIARLEARMAEERRANQVAFETREEAAAQRRKADDKVRRAVLARAHTPHLINGNRRRSLPLSLSLFVSCSLWGGAQDGPHACGAYPCKCLRERPRRARVDVTARTPVPSMTPQRLREALAEAEACRVREASAMAQGSAAAEVLVETQVRGALSGVCLPTTCALHVSIA